MTTAKTKQLTCPECGSNNLVKYGTTFKRNSDGKRERIQQYRCKDCGRITHNPVVKGHEADKK